MATEMNEETDGNQISSISSTFNEMKIMMDDLDMDCLILLKKSSPRTWMSRMLSPFTLTRPTLMRSQVPIELTIMWIQKPQSKITGIKVPIIQMQVKVLQ